jgi:uncharacterized protein (DUF433 family)
MPVRKRKGFGNFLVSDPEICGGDWTFKGTRLLVKDVLFYIGEGKDWKWISEAYDNRLSQEAIGEAVQLACEALEQQQAKQRRAA